MAIGDDFTIDYVNQIISYNDPGSGDIYTVRELYSYLQDTFDELDQLDDTIPMSAQTPTNYTLINGWFMDDRSYRFLKGGAIITNGYDSEIYIKPYDASGAGTAFSASDIGETITETDTSETGKILAYDERTASEIGYVWIRPDGAYTFADADSAYTVSNSSAAGVFTATSTTGEDLLPNLYTLGSIDETDNQQVYIVQGGTRIASGSEWWPESGSGTQHIDVLIKVVELDSPFDSGKLTIFLRHYPDSADKADLYDHFPITISPTGTGDRNAIPLATSLDLNNPTASSTVGAAPYTNITIAFVNGTVTHGGITGTFVEYDDISWTGGTGVSIRNSSGTLTIGNIAGDSGPLNTETITGTGWSCTATADMVKAHTVQKQFEQASLKNYDVCVNCATLELTKVYEYLKYVTRIGSTFTTYGMKYESAALAFNNLDGEQYITAYNDLDTPGNTYSPVKASPFGTFAGGKFFGARGVWIENMAAADVQNFQLIDSDNVGQNPPNKQAVTIENLLSGDRVAVFRTSGGTTIDKEMYSSGAGNVTNNTTFVVNGTISVDTPASGYIRLVDTSDTSASREARYSYTSWSGSTFSGLDKIPETGGLDQEYTQTDDKAYVPYIDQAVTGAGTVSVSVTVIYTTDRTILVRVRRKTATAIIPFETTGSFGSTGFSTSAIRTADTIVQ